MISRGTLFTEDRTCITGTGIKQIGREKCRRCGQPIRATGEWERWSGHVGIWGESMARHIEFWFHTSCAAYLVRRPGLDPKAIVVRESGEQSDARVWIKGKTYQLDPES